MTVVKFYKQKSLTEMWGFFIKQHHMLLSMLTLMGLAYVQSVSFSLVSRSRNRNNINYHIIASIFSNGVWFLTFRELVTADMNLALFIPYTVGTVTGSVSGVKVSQWIEKKLHAESDSHLKPLSNGENNHSKG